MWSTFDLKQHCFWYCYYQILSSLIKLPVKMKRCATWIQQFNWSISNCTKKWTQLKSAEIDAKTRRSVIFFGIRLVLINTSMKERNHFKKSAVIQRFWRWVQTRMDLLTYGVGLQAAAWLGIWLEILWDQRCKRTG